MKKFSILDCTLRDGGYVNNWSFGENAIKNIVKGLSESRADIIELGFLSDTEYDSERSVFSHPAQALGLLPQATECKYVMMVALGEKEISYEKIPDQKDGPIWGIRITFHKEEIDRAFEFANDLMSKGYAVFIQPVGTTSYSEEELGRLIEKVNLLKPFAFYLVDTLGQLYMRDLLRIACFIDRKLDNEIALGFHSHNNLQLSLSNALTLINQDFKRHLIIDTSVYGMGRGVGNLPTELLVQYVNENFGERYDLTPLLVIAERYLKRIYAEHRWGYDLPYFLSAAEKCHPNYASFLMNKETLDIESIAELLKKIPADKRHLFHKSVIEKLYKESQGAVVDDRVAVGKLDEHVSGKKVLLLAPGGSITTYKDEIKKAIEREDAIVISVNFTQDIFAEKIVFISNQKRLSSIKKKLEADKIIIATSNLGDEIPASAYTVNYSSYLDPTTGADNAGAMLIRLLKRTGASEILLAGFDGFGIDISANYYVDSFKREMERETIEAKNKYVSMQLQDALRDMKYRFITPTRYSL